VSWAGGPAGSFYFARVDTVFVKIFKGFYRHLSGVVFRLNMIKIRPF